MPTIDRAALLMLAGMLSACGGAADRGAELIWCRTGDSVEFMRDCRLERIGARGIIFHHSDGGFRRFVLSADGETISAADGAEPARVERGMNGADTITVGRDVYRIETGQLKQ
tara:strand:+ start:6460 stop:6798 length:339 start_codon:yes stop_codon:yes gene_type:complete